MSDSALIAKQLFPPVLLQLTKYQAQGKFWRIVQSFRSRRKVVISALATVLACIWLGQTVLSVLLREPANPDSLRTWLSVSLFLYCVFHAIKIGCRNPVEPFEWNAAEKQLLLTSPLARHQLISYRFISYFGATFAKTLCFSIVMIPDMPSLFVGFFAMFIGLTIVDLFRVLLEVLAWTAAQAGRRSWTALRAAMLLPALTLCAAAFYLTTQSPDFQNVVGSTNPLAIPQLFLTVVEDITTNPLMAVLMWPWTTVSECILAGATPSSAIRLLTLKVIAATALTAVYVLDSFSERHQRHLALNGRGTSDSQGEMQRRSVLRNPPVGLGGAKAIAWYQLLGAIHYRSTLIFALAIPTLLSCAPLLSGQQTTITGLGVIGSVIFYSFLLLPPALMLDFRRDAKRLTLWKSAPITAKSLTVGQLAVPVLLMGVFQLNVMLISVFVAGLSWKMFLALPVLLPMNVLIIGMENAIFLIQPHRRNQEGIEVFLRTILVFTGKGVLFALGLALTLAWAWACLTMSSYLEVTQFAGQFTFLAGAAIALTAAAWLSIELCARLFDRLDVSQDLPPR